MRLGRFEHGPAAATLGEQDFSNVKKRIGTGDLMDFLADEMHRSGIGRECHPHTFGGQNFLNAWRALAAVIESAATSLRAASAIAVTIPVARRATPALVRSTVITPRFALR